jgi:hypothetical protein
MLIYWTCDIYVFPVDFNIQSLEMNVCKLKGNQVVGYGQTTASKPL